MWDQKDSCRSGDDRCRGCSHIICRPLSDQDKQPTLNRLQKIALYPACFESYVDIWKKFSFIRTDENESAVKRPITMTLGDVAEATRHVRQSRISSSRLRLALVSSSWKEQKTLQTEKESERKEMEYLSNTAADEVFPFYSGRFLLTRRVTSIPSKDQLCAVPWINCHSPLTKLTDSR